MIVTLLQHSGTATAGHDGAAVGAGDAPWHSTRIDGAGTKVPLAYDSQGPLRFGHRPTSSAFPCTPHEVKEVPITQIPPEL